MGGENKKIRKEEVIAKLKDDGDFDKLRLKIIRKLKDNVRSFFFFNHQYYLFIFSFYIFFFLGLRLKF